MSNLIEIERQKEIDALQKYKVEHGYAYFDCASETKNDIKNLPSAQPEIIHCRDCKHHHYDSKGIPYCDRIDYGYGWKEDDFCSRGERRTDG